MESRSATAKWVEFQPPSPKRRSSLPVKLQRQEKVELNDNKVAEATRTPSGSKTSQTARLACEGQNALRRGASMDTIAGIPELDADELSLTGDEEEVDIKLEMGEDGSWKVEIVGESQEAKAEVQPVIPMKTVNELPESNEDVRELLLAEIAADVEDELGGFGEDTEKVEVAGGNETDLPGVAKVEVETEKLIFVTEAKEEKAEVTSGTNNELAATTQDDFVTPTLTETNTAATSPNHLEACESPKLQLPNGDVLHVGHVQSALPENFDRSKKICCCFKVKCCRFRRGHSVEPTDVLDEEGDQNPLASSEASKVGIIDHDNAISPVVKVPTEEDKIEVVSDETMGLEMEKAQGDEPKKPGVFKRFGKYLKKQWQMSEAAGSELDYLMKKSATKSTYLSVPPTPTPSLAMEGEGDTMAVIEVKQEFDEKPENVENTTGEGMEELNEGKLSPLVTEIGSSKGIMDIRTPTGLNAMSAKSLPFGSRSWRTLVLGRGGTGPADEFSRCHSATPALRYLEDAKSRKVPPPVKPRRRMKSAPQARLASD